VRSEDIVVATEDGGPRLTHSGHELRIVARRPPEEVDPMSTRDPAGSRPAGRYAPPAGYEQGEGWVLFAGTILAILATLNLIDGIAAVSKSKFFVGHAEFVFANLKTWGWILIIVAIIQGVTAAGVFLRWQGIRWVGVTIAGLNAIVQLLFLPAYPLWALSLFTLDVLVMYGLIAWGGPRQ
jgi:hypothetical protein